MYKRQILLNCPNKELVDEPNVPTTTVKDNLTLSICSGTFTCIFIHLYLYSFVIFGLTGNYPSSSCGMTVLCWTLASPGIDNCILCYWLPTGTGREPVTPLHRFRYCFPPCPCSSLIPVSYTHLDVYKRQ